MAFPEYPTLPSYSDVCKEMLAFWQRRKIFERSCRQRSEAGAPTWVFYEGPPSANGPPGIHHVMGRTLKDVFCRYSSLAGYRVPRQAGWDTHGLPVELSVEKKLGIRKEDIGSRISVEEFNQHCLQAVELHRKDWEKLTYDMGFWVDMEQAYSTCSSQYIESLWWLVSEIYKKGYLRKGYSVQPYSPMAGTALSSHELNQPGCYRKVWDSSVVAQFALTGKVPWSEVGEEPVYLVAWTTTPWTLPAHIALCVSTQITYSLAYITHPTGKAIWLIMAQECLARYAEAASQQEVEEGVVRDPARALYYEARTFLGRELLGRRYDAPLAHLVQRPRGRAYEVVADDFVSTAEGTGIVHLAPCYGAEDERICREEGMASLHIVDDKGHYKTDVKRYGGRAVKPAFAALQRAPQEAAAGDHQESLDVELIRELKERSLAFRSFKYEHNYPHCWRTDEPILYMPVDAWFISTTKLRERLLELNSSISWFPESTGKARFADWLEGVVDWNLSRSRFWGTPLPIWCSRDGKEVKVVGSLRELKAQIDASVQHGLMQENFLQHFDADNLSKEHYDQFDLHRTVVDEVVLMGTGGTPLYRERDVMDVWFDSGAMPYASQHYPFQGKNALPLPADFIAEGVDQTRGWFFSLHVLAALCFDSVAFKKVLAHGLVLDARGQKMSKRLGNTVDAQDVLERYGADLVRWYMLSHAQNGDHLKFDEIQLRENTQKFFDTLLHTYHFFALYARLDGFAEDLRAHSAESMHLWDVWLRSEVQHLIAEVKKAMERCDAYRATRLIQRFTSEKLSNWYVRHNRRRFWQKDHSAPTKLQAYRTLGRTLLTLSQLMAPLAPMLADRLYQDLAQEGGHNWKDSVHLDDYPEPQPEQRRVELEAAMDLVRRITSMALSLREQAGIRVRQPLSELWILTREGEALLAQFPELSEDLLQEVNIKKLMWGDVTDARWHKTTQPHYPRLGKRLGRAMKEAAVLIAQLPEGQVNQLLQGRSVDLELPAAATTITLQPEDVRIRYAGGEGLQISSQAELTVALKSEITQELRREGVARELVSRIQNARKAVGCEITDSVAVTLASHPAVQEACEHWGAYIREETLARSLTVSAEDLGPGSQALVFDDIQSALLIERLTT